MLRARPPPTTRHGRCIAGKAYLYRVFTVDAHSFRSAASVADLTVVTTFTDDPVIGSQPPSNVPTRIKGQHVLQLRQAIDAVRAAAFLPLAWPNPTTPTGPILLAHMVEMRDKLDEARRVLRLGSILYSFPDLDTHSLVHAADVNELRSGVK